MNKIKIETAPDGTKFISFETSKKHSVAFCYDGESSQIAVFEIIKLGKDVLAKDAFLPLQYVEAMISHNVDDLPDGKSLGFPTPLSGLFPFFKKDLNALKNYINQTKTKGK